MPKIRKHTSKRVTIRKKISVQKKVADHKKKLRKEIKKLNKSGVTQKPSKVKKGLPNSYPFKQDALDEADAFEKYKEQMHQDRQAFKRAQKDLPSGQLENYAAEIPDAVLNHQKVNDASKLSKEHIQEAERLMEKVGELPKGTVLKTEQQNEKTGKRAQLKELKKVLQESDIVIEVLDARDPKGCRSSLVRNQIEKEGKVMVVVLCNSDLASNSAKWKNWISQEQDGVSVISMPKDAISTGEGFDEIVSVLKPYEKKAPTVGVVGMPGTIASDINKTLRNMKASQLKKFKILDSYGPVLPAVGSVEEVDLPSQILNQGINVSDLPDKKAALEQILNNSQMIISQIDILKAYKIAKFKSVEQMLQFVAKKNGFMQAGGVFQIEKAAELVIDDLIGGKIKFYTEVPN